MPELISEPITPAESGFDTKTMAQGMPGLPKAFVWRKEAFHIEEVLSTWKQSDAEFARSAGDRYLRRHYFEFRVQGGDRWVVYFLRQTPKSGSARQRWFLYTIENFSKKPGPTPK